MTQELLKQMFEYRDGNLYWKIVKTNSINIGQIAGTNHCEGYRQIKINGKIYKEHRLIWLYHYDVLPTKQIDHINRIRNDNRIENLRLSTNSENCANRHKKNGLSSKYKGVYWFKENKKWQSTIKINNKTKYLGCFHEESAAAQAYNEAAIKHFGEFALINKL